MHLLSLSSNILIATRPIRYSIYAFCRGDQYLSLGATMCCCMHYQERYCSLSEKVQNIESLFVVTVITKSHSIRMTSQGSTSFHPIDDDGRFRFSKFFFILSGTAPKVAPDTR